MSEAMHSQRTSILSSDAATNMQTAADVNVNLPGSHAAAMENLGEV